MNSNSNSGIAEPQCTSETSGGPVLCSESSQVHVNTLKHPNFQNTLLKETTNTPSAELRPGVKPLNVSVRTPVKSNDQASSRRKGERWRDEKGVTTKLRNARAWVLWPGSDCRRMPLEGQMGLDVRGTGVFGTSTTIQNEPKVEK